MLEDCEIVVVHRRKTVWEAHGQYQGRTVTAKGTSEETAVRNWKDAAYVSHPFN
jgi:hypothetical protein